MWRSSSEVDHDHPAPYVPDGRAEDPRIQDPHRIVRCAVVNRTHDGGRSFETLTAGLPQQHAYHLTYGLDVDSTGERLVMGSTTGSLWHSNDGGGSFQHVTDSLPPVLSAQYV